jgi:hypothetical protein
MISRHAKAYRGINATMLVELPTQFISPCGRRGPKSSFPQLLLRENPVLGDGGKICFVGEMVERRMLSTSLYELNKFPNCHVVPHCPRLKGRKVSASQSVGQRVCAATSVGRKQH